MCSNKDKLNPFISVLMSVYNEPIEWVKQSIESILKQTYSNFEFIIINDNPQRLDLDSLISYFAGHDTRIKVYKNQKNIGLTKSLNIGLKLCSGKYIARMDADDISMPKRFAYQVLFMEQHPNVAVCGTDIKLFGIPRPLYIKTIYRNDKDIRGQMFFNSGFVHPTVFIRKSILDSSNITYDESFRNAQDYKLWYDIRNKGEFANIPKKLLKYRISSQQITSKSPDSQQLNRQKISNLFQLDRNPSDKKLAAYFFRCKSYEEKNILGLLRVSLSIKTCITFKERLSIIIKCLLGRI